MLGKMPPGGAGVFMHAGKNDCRGKGARFVDKPSNFKENQIVKKGFWVTMAKYCYIGNEYTIQVKIVD